MNKASDFDELVEHLCTRRSMYVCGGSFYEVCAYLTGYAAASPDCPLSDDGYAAFSRFVCRHFRFPDNYVWPYVLKCCSKDDDDAIERLRVLLLEFCDKRKTLSHEEIIQSVTPETIEAGDGEPEQTLRRLLAALLRGNRREIEPLIQQHEDASILWEGAYPADVADQLDDIARSYSIGRIPTASNAEEVRLITASFPFPITVKQIDGQWKVDAANIVKIRKELRRLRAE